MRKWKRVVALLALSLMVITFTACEKKSFRDIFKSLTHIFEPEMPDDPSTALVILTGNHANSVRHNDARLREEIRNAYLSFGNVRIIVVDGIPAIVYNEKNQPLGDQDIEKEKEHYLADPEKWKGEMGARATTLSAKIAELPADDEEVDTRKALDEAVRAFNDMGKYDQQKIIIYDTGLCTAGRLDFNSKDFFRLDENDLIAEIESLATRDEIPKLPDVTVCWYGLGDVCDPQDELEGPHRKRLREIWGMVLDKAGAKVEFLDLPALGPHQSSHKVSVVSLPPTTPYTMVPPETIDVFFEPDKDVYRAGSGAEATLDDLADTIKNKPDSKWYIVGCTAGSINKNIGELDQYLPGDRARKVWATLRAYGVPESQLETYAMGPYDPWHETDTDDNGLVEQIARNNRRVRIFSSEDIQVKMFEVSFRKSHFDP